MRKAKLALSLALFVAPLIAWASDTPRKLSYRYVQLEVSHTSDPFFGDRNGQSASGRYEFGDTGLYALAGYQLEKQEFDLQGNNRRFRDRVYARHFGLGYAWRVNDAFHVTTEVGQSRRWFTANFPDFGPPITTRTTAENFRIGVRGLLGDVLEYRVALGRDFFEFGHQDITEVGVAFEVFPGWSALVGGEWNEARFIPSTKKASIGMRYAF